MSKITKKEIYPKLPIRDICPKLLRICVSKITKKRHQELSRKDIYLKLLRRDCLFLVILDTSIKCR